VYLLTHYGDEPIVEVVEAFRRIADQPGAPDALEFLAEDFATVDHVGPKRYAAFLGDGDDDVHR
jgi:hypothetical protein